MRRHHADWKEKIRREAELGENAAVFGDPNIVRAVIRISTSLMRLSTIQISQDHCNAIVIDLFTIKAV